MLRSMTAESVFRMTVYTAATSVYRFVGRRWTRRRPCSTFVHHHYPTAAAAATRRVTAVFNYGVNWQPTGRHLVVVSTYGFTVRSDPRMRKQAGNSPVCMISRTGSLRRSAPRSPRRRRPSMVRGRSVSLVDGSDTTRRSDTGSPQSLGPPVGARVPFLSRTLRRRVRAAPLPPTRAGLPSFMVWLVSRFKD